jgi:hypothetical protein
MTIHWDDKKGLLEQEKPHVASVKALSAYPTRCCGNSPGKQHTKLCDMDAPGARTWNQSVVTGSTNATRKKSMGRVQAKMRNVKSA